MSAGVRNRPHRAPVPAIVRSLVALVLALTVGAFVVHLAVTEPSADTATTSASSVGEHADVRTQTSTPGRIGTVRVLSESAVREPAAITAPLGAGPSLRAGDDVPSTGGLTDLIRRYFGAHTVEAIVIVQCESGFAADAVGTNTNGTQDHGLFQINDVHAATFEAVLGRSWEERYDPEVNTAFAAWLHGHAGGWGPWRCNDRLAQFDAEVDGD